MLMSENSPQNGGQNVGAVGTDGFLLPETYHALLMTRFS